MEGEGTWRAHEATAMAGHRGDGALSLALTLLICGRTLSFPFP